MRDDLVYPELSYKIVGLLYDVYNKLGYGYKEKYYQNATEVAFKRSNMQYKREVYCRLKYNATTIGRYYLDFLIEGKVVLELKKGNYFRKKNIEQVYEYLKANNLKLAILANFTQKEVKIKRIVNLRD
jgi:GxxExxY protein